ncbi:MAG: FAD-binding oxidoreductase [bacterium]
MPSISNSEPLWAVGDRLDLPTLVGEVKADVCVVGLGGSGLACAREFGRLGLQVVGIDAGLVAGGAAGRNGGFLLAGLAPFYHEAVLRFGRVRAHAIYQLTEHELARIAEETPATITRSGSVRVAESADEEHDCELQLAAMTADGIAAEAYDGPEGRGILVHGDGTFQPLERCYALAKDAISHGASLFESSSATRVARGVVDTAGGRVEARYVVVAVDGALDVLLPELSTVVRTARLQMLATAPAHDIAVARPVYARWGYDYWQQRPDGVIALGGARDVGGEAEWTHSRSTTEVVQRALERRLREQLQVSASITHRWAANVGYTIDGLPIVRETRPGVWAIGGYSGTGNVIGSLLGRGLARALARDDFSLLRPFLDA